MTYAEYHSFTGTPDAVARRLYALPRETVERTLWVLLLSGAGQARILVQQRAQTGDSKARVLSWEGPDLGDLPADLAALTAGAATPEQLLTALLARGPYADLGIVPCPPTARGAFGHPLRHHERDPEVLAVVLSR